MLKEPGVNNDLSRQGLEFGLPRRAPSRVRHERNLETSVAVDRYGGFDVPNNPLESVNNSLDVDPAEEDLTPEAKDVSLDSAEEAQAFFNETFSEYRASLLEQYPSLHEFSQSEEQSLVERFAPMQAALDIIKQKLEVEDEITDEELENVQNAYDQAVHGPISLQEFVEADEGSAEVFDPATYITENLEGNVSVKASERTQVMLLQESYENAVKNGNTTKAESIAKQIKEHVDELVGNDQVEDEGTGTDLTVGRKSKILTPENLDTGEEKVSFYPKPNSLESLMQLHGDEAGRDIYESRQVVANLRAEAEKAKAQSEAVQAVPVESVETVDVAELASNTELSAEDQLRAVLAEAEVDSLEPVLADEAMDDLFDKLTPEEQLKKDLAEYGVTSLEPDLAEEVYGEFEDVQDEEAPSAVEPVDMAAIELEEEPIKVMDAISQSALIANGVKKIEFKEVGWLDQLLGNNVSPYEVLKDLSFAEVMDWQDNPKQLEWKLMAYKIDRKDYNKWAALEAEIAKVVAVSPDQTFKEVVDEYLVKTKGR